MTKLRGEDGGIEIALQDLLNAQAGKINWSELARHFARGVVVCVGSNEDLLEVAAMMIEDDAGRLDELLQADKLHRALDKDAIGWQQRQSDFWAVVVAPWVLVQEIQGGDA